MEVGHSDLHSSSTDLVTHSIHVFTSAFTRANERDQTRKQSEPIRTLTRDEDANKNEL